MLELLGSILSRNGYRVTLSSSVEDARLHMARRHFPIVLSDINLGPMSGLELLTEQPQKSRQLFIFITGDANITTATAANRHGAFDYLSKPHSLDELESELLRALKRATARLQSDHQPKRPVEPQPVFSKRIVGRSGRMVGVYRAVAKAALHQANVLVIGETGTGKEQVARAIHANSPWAESPFIGVNSGALTESLLESELFGHVKGAFTGASQAKRGLFEEAENGTIFLDEIGEMSPGLQVKLLRAIQEKEIKPVGSSEVKKVHVRVIAATNKDLPQAISEGTFREDLYFRLKVFLVELPSLRERMEDLPELVDYFIADISSRISKPIAGLAHGVLERLMEYAWPGNIRELENAVTHAVVSSSTDVLYLEDFPPEVVADNLSKAEATESPRVTHESKRGPQTLAQVERAHIMDTLQAVGFRRNKAAEILGIDRVTLYRKIARYGIHGPSHAEDVATGQPSSEATLG